MSSKTINIVQIAYIEKIVEPFEVGKSSYYPATTSVKLGAREEG